MRTIGVALQVPEPHGTMIQQARVGFGDSQGHGIPTHITLLTPTVVRAEQLAAIRGHLGVVAAAVEPFTVRLRGAHTFRPVSPVVYLHLAEGAEQCAELSSQIRSGPLACETEFPYHPHVTLAHKIDDASLDTAQREFADYALDFEVTQVHLYEQDEREQWHPVRAFTLGAVG